MNVNSFTSLITYYLPEPQASLLNGIVFGVPFRADYQFYQQLKAVGIVHIVVLSGMNITMLAAIIATLTRQLGKKISVALTIATIVLFILFVGPQPPIIRAGFMGVLSLIGIIYGRKSIALYSLCLSAIFIAIFWPQWLTTISFQLSYAATLGLIIFGSRSTTNSVDKHPSGLIAYLKDELRTSLSAQALTVPLIFYYFRQISFISPVTNVLVAWLIAPLMILGLLTAILGKIFWFMGVIPAYMSYILLTWIVWVVKIFSALPFAYLKF